MFRKICIVINILSLFLTLSHCDNKNSTAFYFSWPQKWHDAAHSNSIAQGTGTPIYNIPTVLWSITDVGLFPDFVSDVDDQAVIDSKFGFIYVKHGMRLRKAYLSDSTQIWSSSLPDEYAFGSNPVIDEIQQMVYAYTSTINGLLMAAFDLETGEFLWLQPGDKPIANLVPSGSPVVHPSGLVLLVGYPLFDAQSTIFALNPIHKTFSYPYPDMTAWSYTRSKDELPTVPAVGPDGSIYVVFNNFQENSTTLIALDTFGTEMWNWTLNIEFPWLTFKLIGVRPDGIIVMTHAFGDVISYFVDSRGVLNMTLSEVQVYAILSDSSMLTASYSSPPVVSLYTAVGVSVWSYQMMSSSGIAAISVDGDQVAYVTSPMDPNDSSCTIYALDVRSGMFLWKQEFVGDDISEAVIAGDGTVIVRVATDPPSGGTSLNRIGCCNGHGVCNLDGMCECYMNWHGMDCSSFCNDSLCMEMNDGRGRCNDVGQCVCVDYYYGNNCTVFCNNTACIQDKSRNAYCDVNGVCTCAQDYYGDKCSIYCDDNKNCSGNGKCAADGTCDCFIGSKFIKWRIGGYAGNDCSKSVFPYPLVAFFAGILCTLIMIVIMVVVFCRRRHLFIKKGYTSIDSKYFIVFNYQNLI